MRYLNYFVLSVFAFCMLMITGCKKVPATEILSQETTLDIPAIDGSYSFAYSVENPIESAEVEAQCEAEWITNLDCSKVGNLSFDVLFNEDKEKRSAEITLLYNGGTAEILFKVNQAAGGPFVITIDEVGLDYAVATIIPADPEMTWHALPYQTNVESEDAYDMSSTDEELVESFMSAYAFLASMSGISLEDFMDQQILAKGKQQMTFNQLGINTDHFIMAIGVDNKGNILSESVREEFKTLDVEKVDIDFTIEHELNDLDVTVTTTPSDNSVRYFTGITMKAEYSDLQSWVHTLIWRGGVMGKTPEEVVKEITTSGVAVNEYYLNANTEYVAFAASLTEDGIVNSEVKTIEFKSGDVPMSDNTFELDILEVTPQSVSVNVTPSNDDSYLFAVTPCSEWEGMTDEEYRDEYIYNNALYCDMHNTSGEQTLSPSNSLLPGTDYYFWVCGYEQSVGTTGVTKVKFTTIAEDDPSLLKFEFSVGEITANSVAVTVTGTPETAFYYFDIAPASYTEEDIKSKIDARVNRWIEIGYKTDRADVFKDYIHMGKTETTITSYNFGYESIQPDTEYKIFAVGIYTETGEYATEFSYSSPFTSLPQ